METTFIEVKPDDVKNKFPKFYDQQGRFFEMCHKGDLIGFTGVRSLNQADNCELEVFISPQYRNCLTKGIVLATLGLPQSLGFKRCWIGTSHQRVIKLLDTMERLKTYDVRYMGTIGQRLIFMKE